MARPSQCRHIGVKLIYNWVVHRCYNMMKFMQIICIPIFVKYREAWYNQNYIICKIHKFDNVKKWLKSILGRKFNWQTPIIFTSFWGLILIIFLSKSKTDRVIVINNPFFAITFYFLDQIFSKSGIYDILFGRLSLNWQTLSYCGLYL